MAFVLQESRGAEPSLSPGSVGVARLSRVTIGVLATIAVHIFMLVGLLMRVLSPIPLPASASSARLLTFDLGVSSDESPRSVETDQSASTQAQAESERPAEPSAEWQESLIKVAREVGARPTTLSISPRPISEAAASRPSAQPGGGFDPYAGAAPQWQTPVSGASNSAPQKPQRPPDMAIAQTSIMVFFARQFASRYPRARGDCKIVIKLNPASRLKEAEPMCPSLDLATVQALRSELAHSPWILGNGQSSRENTSLVLKFPNGL